MELLSILLYRTTVIACTARATQWYPCHCRPAALVGAGGTDGMRTPSRCPLGGTRARAVFFRSKQSSPVRFSTGCGVEQNYTARSEKNESQNFYPLSPCVWPHPPRHQRKLQQSAPRARVLDRSQRAFGSRAASQSSVLQYSGVNSGAPAWVSVSRMKH